MYSVLDCARASYWPLSSAEHRVAQGRAPCMPAAPFATPPPRLEANTWTTRWSSRRRRRGLGTARTLAGPSDERRPDASGSVRQAACALRDSLPCHDGQAAGRQFFTPSRFLVRRPANTDPLTAVNLGATWSLWPCSSSWHSRAAAKMPRPRPTTTASDNTASRTTASRASSPGTGARPHAAAAISPHRSSSAGARRVCPPRAPTRLRRRHVTAPWATAFSNQSRRPPFWATASSGKRRLHATDRRQHTSAP